MRIIQSEVIGDRRVRLVVDAAERYAVRIDVWGPDGWQDISLQSDKDLGLHAASLCYRLRRTEQEVRAIAWSPE